MRKKIVFLLAFLCMLLLAGCSNGKETSKYNIEYLNKDKTGIAEMPYDASATTTDALIEEFFAALSSDPDNVEYRKPIPNDVEITKYSLDGALLTIYFDVDYLNMKEVEEVLCRAAVVRTMTQISGIDCVSFYVDEKPLTDVKWSERCTQKVLWRIPENRSIRSRIRISHFIFPIRRETDL